MAHCPHCGAPYPEGATYCASCGLPLAAAGQRTNRGGKTALVVVIAGGCLLATLFVGGCVAALVIPNFLDALQKAKTKRTIADMRTIADHLESHREQAGTYPVDDGAALQSALAARGHQQALSDGWQHPLRYACLAAAAGGCASYELASAGRDGAFEHQPGQYPKEAFAPNQYDADIVISDGLFSRWPEGQGRLGTGGG
jgi:type II secretory pathway pseudopilin PulG